VRTLDQVDDQDEHVSWSSGSLAVLHDVTPWPNVSEDSAVTAPFVRALEVEGPTTIFDRPERTARDSAIERAVTEDELDDSYEAALKKFV
jgi:hypothetical protein